MGGKNGLNISYRPVGNFQIIFVKNLMKLVLFACEYTFEITREFPITDKLIATVCRNEQTNRKCTVVGQVLESFDVLSLLKTSILNIQGSSYQT